MKKQQSITEVAEQVMAVWRKEGLDPRDMDTAFYNLQNDPITKLLLGAITYQTNQLSADMEQFMSDLLEAYAEAGTPAAMLQPIPAVAMMQTWKRNVSNGKVNEATTWVDTDCEFVCSGKSGPQKELFHFLPLFKTAVYDMPIVSITRIDGTRWHVVMEDREEIASINGLTVFIPRARRCRKVKLSSGGRAINTCDLNEFENLPFAEPFVSAMRFGGNTFQLATVQSLFDAFCCHVNSFCVVNDEACGEHLYRSNGCIELDVELFGVDEGFTLNADDFMINCFPVYNAELHRVTLSQDRPLLRLDLRGSQFLTVAPASQEVDYTDSIVVRTVGTERMSVEQWQSRMKRLIDYFDAEFNVLRTVLDERILNAMQQFVAGIREVVTSESQHSDALYLVLKDRGIHSADILWITTQGEDANGVGTGLSIVPSTAELDPDRTRLATSPSGGRNAVTNNESRHHILQYYMRSKDRIVSKVDIVAFCRFKLMEYFHLSEGSIVDIRIRPDVSIMPDGLYERVIVVDIVLRNSSIDNEDVALSLERMIKSRSCGVSAIRVSVRNS